MNNRIQSYSFLIVFTAFFMTLEMDAQVALEKYRKTAGENNPALKAAFNEYKAALEQIPQVGSLPDPQLAFGFFIQPVETRVGAQQFNASLSQMFPWFGTLGARKDEAAQMAEAKYQEFIDIKFGLYRDVGEAYAHCYYLQKSIAITKTNLNILSSFKELARVNFEGGKTGFTSIMRVEMDEQELKDKLQQLEDTKRPIKAQFEQLLNTKMPEAINIPDTLWQEPLFFKKSVVIDSVMNNSPQLKSLMKMSNVYNNQEKVAKKMGLPSFNIGVNYINISPRNDLATPPVGNGDDAVMFPQIGITLPLYRKKYKAMRSEALLKQEAVTFQREDTANELVSQVERFFANYQSAKRRVELNKNLADLAQRSLDLMQTEFSNSQMDFVELLRMERKILNYRLEVEKGRTDLNIAVYNINYLMGK